MKRRLLGWLLMVVCLVLSSGADAGFTNVFFFGDSLSDSGNNAIIFGPNVTSVPISGNEFIPTFPYSSGHYTNDQVWAQTFASTFGLPADPSLNGGTDYAYGGARTSSSPLPQILSVEDQAALFVSQHPKAPSGALYVVAAGGDNARDALNAIPGCGANLLCIGGIIQSASNAYAGDIVHILGELEGAGARNIVVWDVPDVGKAPAVVAAGGAATGSLLASDMNVALMAAVKSDPNVRVFDLFKLVDEVVQNKGAFGIDLSNVTDACAVNFPTSVPPAQICNPSTYLFWDGIHPTSAGDLIISEAMVAFVPEPATLPLIGLACAGIGLARRRKLH